MTGTQKFLIALGVLLVFGIIIFPIINRRSFRNLPADQQIRILMKEAKGLAFFKNVSRGSTGVLYYVKNKRKILAFPWRLIDGKMLVIKKDPFNHWDYPEEKEPLNEDEINQLMQEIDKFNKNNPVKLVFNLD